MHSKYVRRYIQQKNRLISLRFGSLAKRYTETERDLRMDLVYLNIQKLTRNVDVVQYLNGLRDSKY